MTVRLKKAHLNLSQKTVEIQTTQRKWLSVPMSWFEPRPNASPDFTDIEVIDEGLTLRLGPYEVDGSLIIQEFLTWQI